MPRRRTHRPSWRSADEVKIAQDRLHTKALCRKANVEKLDGTAGGSSSSANKQFSNPAGLVQFIGEQGISGEDQARPERGLHP